MSQIVEFYRGTATDAEGRLLADIWTWNDEDLEDVHDYIQWLFPLPEPSQFNPNAPLLTSADIAIFSEDQKLRANVRKSFERIVTFLGLEVGENGHVVDGPNILARSADIW